MNMTPEKAARILCALQDVSPSGFLENLDDHGHDDMRGYENFSEAIDAIRAMLNQIAFQQAQQSKEAAHE